MGNMKAHCNAYGFLGAFCAITSAVAYFLVKNKEESCIGGYKDLQTFHMVGIVAGIVICVASIFALANFLGDITPLLVYVAAIAIVVVAGVMGYAAYYVFPRPCMPLLGFIPFDGGFGSDRNVFNAEDGKMIAVFILDILSCIMFLSAAANFSRRA